MLTTGSSERAPGFTRPRTKLQIFAPVFRTLLGGRAYPKPCHPRTRIHHTSGEREPALAAPDGKGSLNTKARVRSIEVCDKRDDNAVRTFLNYLSGESDVGEQRAVALVVDLEGIDEEAPGPSNASALIRDEGDFGAPLVSELRHRAARAGRDHNSKKVILDDDISLAVSLPPRHDDRTVPRDSVHNVLRKCAVLSASTFCILV